MNLALNSNGENTALLRLRANVFANLGLLLAETTRVGLAEQNSTRAIEEFQKLAENPGEPQDIESLAKARLALARLLVRQGKSKDAIATLEDALKAYKQLVNSDEDSTTYLAGLADTRVTLGNALHSTGDIDRQLAFYQEAAADYLELIQARPGVPRYRSNLVATQTNIAQVLYRQGDAETAIEELSVALQQVEALPDSPEKVEQDAYVRVTFGQVLRDSGADTVNTESAFESADELCATLVKFRPDHSPYRVLHGEVKNNVGVHYLLDNDLEKAHVAFKSALADFDKAIELNKDDVAASHGRAWCLNYLADTLYELSRKDEAAKLYEQAIKARAALCRSDPHSVEYQYAHAWLLLNCQDRSFRDALAGSRIAARLSNTTPDNGRLLVLHALGQLRSDDYFGVIKSLGAAVKYRLSNKTPADFIRAMALWMNEDKSGAVAAWKTAINTMDRYAPGDVKLRRLRAESATLLQIQVEETPAAPSPANE